MNIKEFINFINEIVGRRIDLKEYNKIATDFYIRPIREKNDNALYYEFEEKNDSKLNFYFKFPCFSKDEFYSEVAVTIIENVYNCEDFIFAANIRDNGCNMFSVVTKNNVKINFILEDEKDVLIFDKFKAYLNLKTKNEDNKKLKKIPELY